MSEMSDSELHTPSSQLESVTIENLALIDNLTVEFKPGLNVITGPTGSGKTMVIKAMKLALGNRANYDLLPDSGNSEINVQFMLSDSDGNPFGNNSVDGELIFKRELTQDRSSKVYLNNDRVRLKRLRQNRKSLIDFHGQHDNQAIFESNFAREVLDRFGDYDEKLNEYNDIYSEYSELENELESLQGNDAELDQRLELLQYQLGELDEFSPEEGEWNDIESRRRRLESREEIERTLNESVSILVGENSITSKLGDLVHNVEELADFKSDLENWVEELRSSKVLMEEFRRELKEVQNDLTGAAGDYEELMERRSRWLELSRKHDVPPEELHQEYITMRDEKEKLQNREKRTTELKDKLAQLEQELYKIANKLHQERQKASGDLEDKVIETLSRLKLENAQFEVRIVEEELGPAGFDKVEWLFSSHESEPPGPLSSRLSGGEISRVLLGIKSALAEADRTDTLVFDEIDTGISGEEANRVGEVLTELSNYHQVICITHLPLVASKADNHVKIRRSDSEDNVSIDAFRLEDSSRVDELSRLISGDESSTVSREQAAELLE